LAWAWSILQIARLTTSLSSATRTRRSADVIFVSFVLLSESESWRSTACSSQIHDEKGIGKTCAENASSPQCINHLLTGVEQ
jgi:hypothetical protein